MSTPPIDQHRPTVSFVAHNAFGALANRDNGHIGGIERQQSLMAKWLAARDYRVSMITWDEGQEDGQEIDGVQVLKVCTRDAGIPGLRFFWPRWTSLAGAMRRADADIYYYNCGDLGLGQVVAWCRINKRKSVYSVASDPDCNRELPELQPLRERLLYRYGLRRVDKVIVQTRRQQEMLREGFKKESGVIPMPCADADAPAFSSRAAPIAGGGRVLWIGRIDTNKRLEWLLDLADRHQDLAFDVVGAANRETEYASSVVSRARGLPNVEIHGRLQHSKLWDLYGRASVLCCTSRFEGLPNTFLEAWRCGLPVISTVDPDGLIASRGLGGVADNVPSLARGIRDLLSCPQRWRQASENARRYYLENHTVNVAMGRFETVLRDVATTSQPSKGR